MFKSEFFLIDVPFTTGLLLCLRVEFGETLIQLEVSSEFRASSALHATHRFLRGFHLWLENSHDLFALLYAKLLNLSHAYPISKLIQQGLNI